jgi:outer membrane biosynthesis protein TonB
MTLALPPGRALAYRMVSRPLVKKLPSSVVGKHNVGYLSSLATSAKIFFRPETPQCRFYATKPGKPKAHTGRVAAPKRKPTSTATTTPKKTSDGTKPAAKKSKRKTIAKSKSKVKSKAKAKPKAKPKAKRKPRTEEQKAARDKKLALEKRRSNRKQALLDPPRKLPATPFFVYNAQSVIKGTNAAIQTKTNALEYQSLNPEQKEVRSHVMDG